MNVDSSGAAARHPEITAIVLDILGEIAPEIDTANFDPSAEMRYEFEIDSIDFLNLMIGIHERLDIDVPETDYGRVVTIDDLVSYLVAHGAIERV